MYTTFFRFFGLRANPFNVSPDPEYLFLNPRTQALLDDLASAIQARKGLLLLTGEAGTGKTTLLNVLRQGLQKQKTPTAFIFNPHLEVNEFFDLMLAEFGISCGSRLKGSALARLNQWLVERYRAGKNSVVILDEAQGLPEHVLEEIRMLLNHDSPPENLLQIVLSGQPELEARLKHHELRHIRQHISLRCRTMPLTVAETHEYIETRLEVAGGTLNDVFAPEAISAAHYYSSGIPRVLNILCEHAMIQAYLAKARPVPAHLLDEVAQQLQFDDVKPTIGRRNLELDILEQSPLSLPAIEPPPAMPAKPTAKPTAALPWAVDGLVAMSDRSTQSLTASEPTANHKDEPIRVLEFRTQDSRLEPSEPIAEPSKISVAPRVKAFEAAMGAAVAHARRAIASFDFSPLRRLKPKIPGFVLDWDFSRLHRLDLPAARWRSGLAVLSRRFAHRLSAGWRKVSEIAKRPAWQQNVDSLVRWLQQPLPTVKVHRKAGH